MTKFEQVQGSARLQRRLRVIKHLGALLLLTAIILLMMTPIPYFYVSFGILIFMYFVSLVVYFFLKKHLTQEGSAGRINRKIRYFKRYLQICGLVFVSHFLFLAIYIGLSIA